MSSARVETSVAVIRRACPEQCSTCTPHPVPTSSRVSTGRRTVARASDSDAAPVPSTCSRSAVRPPGSTSRSDSTHHGAASGTAASPCGRRSRAAETCPSRSVSSPADTASSTSAGSSAAATSSRGTASPSRNSRTSVPASPASRTARRAGVVSPRSSAARASGPRRAATPSTVNSVRTNAVRKPRHNRASGTTTPSVTAMSESGRSGRGTHAIVTLQPQSIIAALAATPPIAPLPRAGKCVTVRTQQGAPGVDGARRCP